jgi:hypothetical protein
MIDLMSAGQEAVFVALEAGVDLASVHDHVKQDTDPPFVKIGEITTSNEGTKGDQAEILEVEVHTVYRGADRSVLLAIMHQEREALDEQTLSAGGAAFRVRFVSAAASDAGPDGVTYAGIGVFELFAEAD